jgi:hypothetical protein
MAKKSKLTDIEKANKKIDELTAANEAREQAESKDEENVKLEMQRLEILIAQKRALGEVNNAKQLELQLMDKMKDLVGDAFESTKELQDLETQLADEKDTNKRKELKRQIDSIYQTAMETEGYGELYKQLVKNTKGTDKLTKAQKAAKDSFDSTFQGLATKIGLNSSAFNSFSDGIAKFQKLAAKNPKQVRESLQDTFSMQRMGGAILAQMFESTLELAKATDRASAAFAAHTGAGRIMTEQISEMTNENRNLGISAASAGKAYQGLFDGFTGFMSLGKEAQKELGATVAGLERLGIDGGTATKTLTLFNMNMGVSLKQSQKLTKQLAIMGTEIGISSKKMLSGFVEASKSLAVYGKGAVKVFSDLAAQAKAANVETSTLLGLADKFDTFGGAAETAGKLNSILGTQISATEMLTMKENERIETLIRSIQAQGTAFKDMDRFSQKAIANAAGITDMAEAQRIFGMSVNDYRKGLRGNADEEEFNQRLKDTMDIMEKLKKLGQQFAISIAPLLDGFAYVIQKILDFNQYTKGYFIPTLGIILGGLIFIPKIVGLFTTFLGVFSTAAPAATPGITIFSKALARAAPAFLKGALGMLALGAALVVIGLGFSAMGSAFGGDMSGSKVLGFLGGLALGLILLSAGFIALGAMMAPPFGFLFAAGVGAMAGAIIMLGLAMATLNFEKTKMLSNILSIISGDNEVKTKFTAIADIQDFTNHLIDKEAVLKPVLGDLALMTTGKTTQSVTTNTVGYNLNTFAAKFENTFKPNITVKIGDEALDEKYVSYEKNKDG